ncbi:MAG: hypothetical protein JRE23_12235 [Deltaproteobacteria bacterium]|nr:hypothetical protein [Deltaproteobacteria bacterium]
MRKTVTFLNQLRLDVDTLQQEIDEAGCSMEEAAQKLSHFPVHDLVTNDYEFKQAFNQLVFDHKEMSKLIKSFRKAREAYLEAYLEFF